jgi:chromosome partitioning protein
VEDTIININDGLDLIPSDFENSTLDILIAKYGKDLRHFISTYVEQLKSRYDFVIIDCNPSLSPLNVSIALASDLILIPVNPDKFSKKGLKKTVAEIERITKEYRTEISYNLLFTLYDGREALSHKFLMEYGTEHGDKLLPTVIKRSADVKTAIDQKKSIFDFKKASAREDFDLLAQEILGIRNLNKKEVRA